MKSNCGSSGRTCDPPNKSNRRECYPLATQLPINSLVPAAALSFMTMERSFNARYATIPPFYIRSIPRVL